MADIIINSTVTTQQSLTGSDALIIGSLGNLLVTGAGAVSADGNNDILVNGTIASEGSAISSSGTSLELIVGTAGSILSSGSYGVYCSTTGHSEIRNGGEIRGTGTGLSFNSADNSGSIGLVNTGQIVGDTAIIINNGSSTSTVANSGSIVGETYGIYANYSSSALLRVANTGTGPSARTVESGANTLVFVDTDGDGAADMRITVTGTLGLTEAEFIL
ncbi:MAG: hypothetical protein GY947_17555 [Rhodobacteraceae bacterium]|nr:hypothetical protein [Paracoccaceae bacterium]